MSKFVMFALVLSSVVFAKDFNPTCETYAAKKVEVEQFKVKLKEKEEQLKSYERVRYNKDTIKALKKEIKGLEGDLKDSEKMVKNASEGLKDRINYLKKNFDQDIKITPEEVIAECAKNEYSKVMFSKILLKKVVPVPGGVDDGIALAACMDKLEQIQQKVSANVDNSAFDDIRQILDVSVSSSEDESSDQ